LAIGWRNAMAVFAGLAVFGLVIAVKMPGRREEASSSGAEGSKQDVALVSSTERFLKRLTVHGFLVAASTGLVQYFLPLFVRDEFGASPALGGAVAALAASVGAVARLAWGPPTGRARDVRVPSGYLALGAALGFLALAASTFVGLWLVWPAVILVGATGLAYTTPAMVAIMRTVGPLYGGTAAGRYMRGVYLGGVASPIGFGWLIEVTGGYTLAWVVAAVMAIAAAATMRTTLGAPALFVTEDRTGRKEPPL